MMRGRKKRKKEWIFILENKRLSSIYMQLDSTRVYFAPTTHTKSLTITLVSRG